MPSFHAFTGCDYTSSFFRKAKSRPFDLLAKDRRFASAFGQLGSSRSVGAEVGAIIEEYVCAMYGVRNVTDVNEARYHLFRKLYAPTKPDQPLEKIKSSDPCCLPPCKTVLEQKLRRTNYVARIWRNARLAQPVEFGPDVHGWRVVNDKLQFVWFERPQNPPNVSFDSLDEDDGDSEDDDDIQGCDISSDESDESDEN